MFGLGVGEVILILVLGLVFIGPKKLPELAKSLGKGIREFQKAKDDMMDTIQSSTTDEIDEVTPLVEEEKSKTLKDSESESENLKSSTT